MELKLTASSGRRNAASFFAGAGSCVLHAMLAAGFLYCLPVSVGSGEGEPLTLLLLSLPGEKAGGENSRVEGAEIPSARSEEHKAPQVREEQSRSVKAPAGRVEQKAAQEKKNEQRRSAPDAKRAEVRSGANSGGSPALEAPAAVGDGGSAASSVVADVPFGRSCGPAFTRFSRPVYPLQARRAGISGLVRLRVSLDDAGSVRGIEVLESGHRLLTDAACAAIRRSSFRPYTQNGKSLPSRTVIPIRFSLEQAL